MIRLISLFIILFILSACVSAIENLKEFDKQAVRTELNINRSFASLFECVYNSAQYPFHNHPWSRWVTVGDSAEYQFRSFATFDGGWSMRVRFITLGPKQTKIIIQKVPDWTGTKMLDIIESCSP